MTIVSVCACAFAPERVARPDDDDAAPPDVRLDPRADDDVPDPVAGRPSRAPRFRFDPAAAR